MKQSTLQKKAILFMLVLISYNSLAQPNISWNMCLGGGLNDTAKDMIDKIPDGKFVLLGESNSNDGDVSGNHGVYDIWVAKVGNNDEIIWQRSLGGWSYDIAGSIALTYDNNYIICGGSQSDDGDLTLNQGDYDFWVIKLSNTGTIIWQKTYGGSGIDIAKNIKQTVDGGFIACGYTSSYDGDISLNQGGFRDIWVLKLNSLGEIEWEKTYGGSDSDYSTRIEQTNDGGYIICGSSNSNDGDITGNNGNSDLLVIKINSLGTIEWSRSYGGSSSEEANDVVQTSDGGYILAGSTMSNDGDVTDNHGESDVWVVKLNANGNLAWQKALGGSSSETANSVRQLDGGGYIISGSTFSTDGDIGTWTEGGDCWILKLDSTGNILWENTFGGSDSESSVTVFPAENGGYLSLASTASVDGDVTGNHGDYDCWVFFLDEELNTDELNNSSFFITPNPTNGELNLNLPTNMLNSKITIIDNTGKIVFDQPYIERINIGDFATGIYTIEISNGNEKIVKKVIKR